MIDFFRKRTPSPPPANPPRAQPDPPAEELDKKDVLEAFDVNV